MYCLHFLLIVAIAGVGALFRSITSADREASANEYVAKDYNICDVKLKDGTYCNVAVKEDEITSYKEKKSFMMTLHSRLSDNICIVSTDDITGITIHTGEGR